MDEMKLLKKKQDCQKSEKMSLDPCYEKVFTEQQPSLESKTAYS